MNQEVLGILANTTTMTLATCSLQGEPHAAAVYFASDSHLHLFFFSDPNSQHIRDGLENPLAAASIHPECQSWRDIHGLQLRGRLRRIEAPDEWKAAWELYTAKFPFVAGLKVIVRRNALFAFIPEWVRLVDNRRSFGHKEEFRLE